MTPHELRATLDRLDLSAAEAGHLLASMLIAGRQSEALPTDSHGTPGNTAVDMWTTQERCPHVHRGNINSKQPIKKSGKITHTTTR
jgi:hypothetical protein